MKILPYINAVYIDDVAYTPVLEKIDELRLPVMIQRGPSRYAEFIGYWQQFIETIGKPQYRGPVFYKTAAGALGLTT